MPNTIDNKNLFLDTQFQQFVQFAETAIAAGKQKAIARVETSEVGGIANRTIVPGSGDSVNSIGMSSIVREQVPFSTAIPSIPSFSANADINSFSSMDVCP